MKRLRPATGNPLPTTLEDALQEIFRLQRQLNAQNIRHEAAFNTYARTVRALKGSLRKALRDAGARP